MKKPSKTRARHAHFFIGTLVLEVRHCLLDNSKWKLEQLFDEKQDEPRTNQIKEFC